MNEPDQLSTSSRMSEPWDTLHKGREQDRIIKALAKLLKCAPKMKEIEPRVEKLLADIEAAKREIERLKAGDETK